MTATPDDLFRRLDDLGIRTITHHHPALFTVADSKRLRGDLPGGHCKSLFLKDKKGALYLVVALEDRAIDLKSLRKVVGANNLSFGSANLLEEVLGVSSGAVTPFALINDMVGRLAVVLDKDMLTKEMLNYHPLTNEWTTAIAPSDLLTFIAACGHDAKIIDFDAPDGCK